jgi:hypothetical protein
VGMMPQWLAKTPEMYAFDQYFSLGTGPTAEADLEARYLQALGSLQVDTFWQAGSIRSLNTEWKSAAKVERSIDGHFVGDWINENYPRARSGGSYWPQVPSKHVIHQLRAGVTVAIRMALGKPSLKRVRHQFGIPKPYLSELFQVADANGISTSGVLPLVMTWVCVAPAGENFFEVDAVRGPTVVEFAVATPRPMGHSSVLPLVDRLQASFRSSET